MATADLSGVQLHLVDSVEMAERLMRWLSECRPHDAIIPVEPLTLEVRTEYVKQYTTNKV